LLTTSAIGTSPGGRLRERCSDLRSSSSTFPTAQILDVTGPLKVFSSASRFLPAAGYRAHVMSRAGDPIRASCGLQFATTSIA